MKKKVMKSFVTKKKKSCLKTRLKTTRNSQKKNDDKFDCSFVDELKLRSQDSCLLNPNYAIICDFLIKFSEILELPTVPLKDLQLMIGSSGSPHHDLVRIHILLLRKLRLPKIIISEKNWEKALVLFCKRDGDLELEGVQLEGTGYSDLRVNVRLEILKCLMEVQFLCNEVVKNECDLLPTEELRQDPTGLDIQGNIYWTQMSEEGDLRIYAETSSRGSWETVAQTRDNLVEFMTKLKQEKMYVVEQEKLAEAEKKEAEAEAEKTDLVEELQKEQETAKIYKPEYGCEICTVVAKTSLQLREHYSSIHLTRQLKEKFPHLVEKRICKLCQFDARTTRGGNEDDDDDDEDEDDLIWVHLGTIHDKINVVLKDEGLGLVKEINKLNCDKTSCDNTNMQEDSSLSLPTDNLPQNNKSSSQSLDLKNPENENNDAQNMSEDALKTNDSGSQCEDEKDKDNPSKENEANKEDEDALKNGMKSGQYERRRSTRLNKAGLDPVVEKAIRESVELEKLRLKQEKEDKKRLERKLSCKLCGLYDSDSLNPVYTCACGYSWHKDCTKPKLYSRPTSSWRCPLCNHTGLVAMLQQVLIEFDAMMEQAQQRRLARLRDNRSASSVGTGIEEDEDSEYVESVEDERTNDDDDETGRINEGEGGVEEGMREMVDAIVKDRETMKLVVNYCETSEEDEVEEDEEEKEWKRIRSTCLCEGAGKCVYCKRLKGCTCEGAGTCRLCVSLEKKESSSDSSLEVIEHSDNENTDLKMSTTELFLLTGETKTIQVPKNKRLFTPTGKPRKGGSVVVPIAEIVNLTDDVTIYQSSSRGQASPRGSLTPRRGYSPSRGSTPRGSSTPRGEFNREMTLYKTPHGTPVSDRGTTLSGRGTPRGTPLSSRIVPGSQNRSLADSARRRNLFQEIIDIDEDEDEDENEDWISPDSAAAKYFPERVRYPAPAPAPVMRAATPRRTPAPVLRWNMRAAGAVQGRVIRTGRSPAPGRYIVRPPVVQRTSQGQNDQYAIQSFGNQDAYNDGAYEEDAYLNDQYSTEEDYDDVSNAGTYANYMPNVSTQKYYRTEQPRSIALPQQSRPLRRPNLAIHRPRLMNQRPHQRPQMMHPQRPRISPQRPMYSPQQHLLSSPRAFTPRMTRTKTRTRSIRGLEGTSRGALLQNSYPGQSNIQAAGLNQLPSYASGGSSAHQGVKRKPQKIKAFSALNSYQQGNMLRQTSEEILLDDEDDISEVSPPTTTSFVNTGDGLHIQPSASLNQHFSSASGAYNQSSPLTDNYNNFPTGEFISTHTKQYDSTQDEHEEFVDTADYSNEDFSIHSLDVIEEIEPSNVFSTSTHSTAGGARKNSSGAVFSDCFGARNDLVLDEEFGARIREELGDPGELGRNESELARLPPGILVRKVLEEDIVELE